MRSCWEWLLSAALLGAGWLAAAGSLRPVRPYFEDAFDLGAGGATLTWATQEGVLLNNPALLPFGAKALRWLGSKTTLSPDTGLLSAGALENPGAGSSDTLLEQASARPLHLGLSQAFTFISEGVALSVFAGLRPDVRVWPRGAPGAGGGTSQIRIRAENYGGAVLSGAIRINSTLGLGLTLKHLAQNEIDHIVETTALTSSVRVAQLVEDLQAEVALNRGSGADLALLQFYQGRNLDLKLAAVVAQLGGMPFPPGGTALQQLIHAGVGLTLHGEADALHLAADLRDLEGHSGLPLYQRVFIGSKLLLHGVLGLSAGIHHGLPTYGVALDLWLLRLAASRASFEYEKTPGLDRRNLTTLSLMFGAEF